MFEEGVKRVLCSQFFVRGGNFRLTCLFCLDSWLQRAGRGNSGEPRKGEQWQLERIVQEGNFGICQRVLILIPFWSNLPNFGPVFIYYVGLHWKRLSELTRRWCLRLADVKMSRLCDFFWAAQLFHFLTRWRSWREGRSASPAFWLHLAADHCANPAMSDAARSVK